MPSAIPFNKPYLTGRELSYIAEAHRRGHLSGDGEFTRRCHRWLTQSTGAGRALLTHSCTAGLEMAALLANIGPGDEVILPSYTFVSTANAFALRGATPVFVDVRPDTFNLDESKVEAAITTKTRAIVAVHYAGVACAMSRLLEIAARHRLLLIEDAAQALLSRYQGRPLGSFGALSAVSFHETKNIISGEGGALLLNDLRFFERAEIIREKGTNRSQFFRGQVDKYTWVDVGSSFLPSELVAAFLWAQMEAAEEITQRRLALWDRYHAGFAGLEAGGAARRPVIPADCAHNAHMYYLVLPSLERRSRLIDLLRQQGIQAVFHYVSLHDSPVGRKLGRVAGPMTNTVRASECLVRLPLWLGMDPRIDEIIDAVLKILD